LSDLVNTSLETKLPRKVERRTVSLELLALWKLSAEDEDS